MCGPEGNHSHHHPESSQQPSHLDNGNRKSRTLVLCFDGTNDVFDEDNTNIIRLFAALEKARPNEQLVYYQPGIGTYVRPEAPWAPHIRDVAKKIDQGFAWYIGTHITGGYKFLMQHYNEGDRICLFGFSRGAFTARCLAGMLHKVGLLPRSNTEHVDFAYTLYESRNPDDIRRARQFKETFSVHVEVEFIGVWDTVASVGIGAPVLPFNASETFVRTFRHALAIDERRAKFQPNPWKHQKPCECTRDDQTQDDGGNNITGLSGLHANCDTGEKSTCWCKDDKRYHNGVKTNVLEVWFPGFHADVGGGNAKNHEDKTSLANPSLRWMVTEILKAKPGVIFKKDAFEERLPSLAAKVKAFQTVSASQSYFSAKPHHCAHAPELPVPNGNTMTPPLTPGSSYSEMGREGTRAFCPYQTKEELEEANAEWHDMLDLSEGKWRWWILEYLPLTQTYIDKNHKETNTWPRFNGGEPRSIKQYYKIPNFHRSVRYRSESNSTYKPQDKLEGVKYVHEDDDLPEDVLALGLQHHGSPLHFCNFRYD